MSEQPRETRYVLNQNEGVDTLHRDPVERCNTDDVDDRKTIDERTALALKASGDVRACAHCWPEVEDSA